MPYIIKARTSCIVLLRSLSSPKLNTSGSDSKAASVGAKIVIPCWDSELRIPLWQSNLLCDNPVFCVCVFFFNLRNYTHKEKQNSPLSSWSSSELQTISKMNHSFSTPPRHSCYHSPGRAVPVFRGTSSQLRRVSSHPISTVHHQRGEAETMFGCWLRRQIAAWRATREIARMEWR